MAEIKTSVYRAINIFLLILKKIIWGSHSTGVTNMSSPFTKKQQSYSQAMKDELGTLCLKLEEEFTAAKAQATLEYDRRRGKHTHKAPKTTQQGFKSRAVRQMFPDLRDAKSDDPEFKRAVCVANRAYETAKRKRDAGIIEDEPSSKRFR